MMYVTCLAIIEKEKKGDWVTVFIFTKALYDYFLCLIELWGVIHLDKHIFCSTIPSVQVMHS